MSGSGSRRPYVLYASVPWDRSWLVDQSLATALGRRHEVLYVEPAITPLTPLRSPADRALGVLRRRPRPVAPGVHAVRPVVLPPREAPAVRRASRPLLRRQVRGATRRLGMAAPVLLSVGALGDLAGAIDEALAVYLMGDLHVAGAHFMGLDQRRVAADAAETLRHADLVVASSDALVERLRREGHEAELLPHGFAADLAGHYDTAVEPPELAALPRPRLGYAGTLDARIDLDVLGILADDHPGGTLVHVGQISPRLSPDALAPLRRRSNVAFLGPVDRRALPAYLRHLDVCLLPYQDSEWQRHAAPLKLWDYLYAGPPIVGSNCPAYADLPDDVVRLVETRELPQAVRDALTDPDRGREHRRALALANSWDARAARLSQLVEERLMGR